MNRHELLAGLHEILQPRTYLEIGVNQGHSLALSRCRSIAVDPAFRIRSEVACDLNLVRATSDDFFAGPDALAWFGGVPIDLAFIDGMHVFEFALRDFMNCEKHAAPGSVVVLDDMLPRHPIEAARDRISAAWAGDVYKVTLTLEQYRPDLVVIPVDTEPTGTVVVVGLDPASQVLRESYDEILRRFVVPDPQDVPAEVLRRTTAAAPEQLLASPIWAELRDQRGSTGRPDVSALAALRGTATFDGPNDPPRLRRAAKKAAANKPAKKAAAKKAAARRKAKRRAAQ